MANQQMAAIENPGPPGFSRFWGARIAGSAVMSESLINGRQQPKCNKTFTRESFARRPKSTIVQILSRMKVSVKEGAFMPPPE